MAVNDCSNTTNESLNQPEVTVSNTTNESLNQPEVTVNTVQDMQSSIKSVGKNSKK